MAVGNPQKEDGYTPIANELLEQLIRFDLSKRQWAVVMCIARMTFGYSKKSDALSGWQIAQMTNLDRSDVSKTIKELAELNIIKKLEKGRQSHGVLVQEISINKHYNQWLTVGKTPTVGNLPTVGKTPTVTVGKTPTEPLVKHPTHKAIKQENNITPKNTFFSEIDSDVLSQWLDVRKKKKGSNLSKIVYDAVAREAKLANLSIEEAIVVCVERNWITFNAEWYGNSKSKSKEVQVDKRGFL